MRIQFFELINIQIHFFRERSFQGKGGNIPFDKLAESASVKRKRPLQFKKTKKLP